ncbi:MAG: hypothetical protein SPL96_11090 [Bacteroidales bacterium]|nr:hypothetical protein [Bacteroidales bacterium]
MTPREFFDKVAAMRDAQKKYFKSRSRFDLDTAKRLEREIDDEIARVEAIERDKPAGPTQLTLF